MVWKKWLFAQFKSDIKMYLETVYESKNTNFFVIYLFIFFIFICPWHISLYNLLSFQ